MFFNAFTETASGLEYVFPVFTVTLQLYLLKAVPNVLCRSPRGSAMQQKLQRVNAEELLQHRFASREMSQRKSQTILWNPIQDFPCIQNVFYLKDK